MNRLLSLIDALNSVRYKTASYHVQHKTITQKPPGPIPVPVPVPCSSLFLSFSVLTARLMLAGHPVFVVMGVDW